MNHQHEPEIPTTLSLVLFQPDSNVLYSLDAIAHIAGVSRRSILIYCRAGLVRPVIQPPYGVMAFTVEEIHCVQQIEQMRSIYGIDVELIKRMFDLIDEVERQRAGARYFAERQEPCT